MESTYNKPNTKNMKVETHLVRHDQYKNLNKVSAASGTDRLKEIQDTSTIVLGAGGHMGGNIADACNRASTRTFRVDIDKAQLAKAEKTTIKNQETAAKLRKLSHAQRVRIETESLRGPGVVFKDRMPALDGASDKTTVTKFFFDANVDSSIRAEFAGSKLIIEALPEILGMKQNQFEFYIYGLEGGPILATNTSTLEIDKVAAKVPEHLKHKVVGLHYFDPADRNPLVEIIAGTETSVETVLAMRDFSIAMGKMPIVSWGDSPLAVANRILVGVLNEAAHIANEGTNPDLVDKVFLKTFYSEQITVKLKKAQKQFELAPKLAFFKDEKAIYKQIAELDAKIQACTDSDSDVKRKLCQEKKTLIENALFGAGKLIQKSIYAEILENAGNPEWGLGSFFAPPAMVATLKENAKQQIKILKANLASLETPLNITPYDYPKPKTNSQLSEKEISDRLKAAYIAIAQAIYLEGLATPQDIELACKEGFKWNVGPFELLQSIGRDEAVRLTKLVNARLPEGQKTGISKPGAVVELNKNAISGVQTFIQNGIGHIVMGRRHIQFLEQSVNSLSPEMLVGIRDAVKQFESDPNVKAIFFESQGGGPFSAGADLTYVMEKIKWDTEKTKKYLDFGYDVMMNVVRKSTKPTVAIMDGVAYGGGGELASACDYIVGTYDAGVSFPEVNNVKIYPGWGAPETFSAKVGNLLAEAIMVSPVKRKGLVVLGAQDAYDAGFFDKLVLQSELPHLKTALINGEVPGINIYLKPPPKANQNRPLSEYTYDIVKNYGLDKLSNPKRRIFGRFVADLTRKLIANPQYKPTEEELRKTLRSGWLNSKLFIESKLAFAKSSIARFVGK